jgi:hypothetical protein
MRMVLFVAVDRPDQGSFSRQARRRVKDSFFSVLGHPTGPARSTIDEVRDRLRIIGVLIKIRTPGAQTGRCARSERRSSPVRWNGIGGQRDRSATSSIDRETVDDFVDANTVDRMHRRTRYRGAVYAGDRISAARTLVPRT